MGRSVLASGQLGQHNGLPCTIIVSTTLQELESGCGQAVTATATLLPMSTVIRMDQSRLPLPDNLRQTHMAVHSTSVGHAASPPYQRIMLHANGRGAVATRV